MQESIFYTKDEVSKVTKLAKSSIDRLEAEGKFPRRMNLTGKPNGKVVWLKSEVHEWCLARSRRMLKPPSDDSHDDASWPPLH